MILGPDIPARRTMAVKQVVVSDISGAELTDADHTRVVVQHPDIPAALELDISTSEAAKLTDSTLRLVSMTIYEPDRAPRTIQMETKVLDRLFGDIDFDRVLEGARRADLKTVPPSRRPGRVAASRAEKVDYTAADRFGQLHRGRITAEEARLVREQPTQASANREVQGHPPINFEDPAERKRYGL
jgi:hypothetical protein